MAPHGWHRFTEALAWCWRGTAVSPRWHHGHGCIAGPHNHASCTHEVCGEAPCAAPGCHVVLVHTALGDAYVWQHHPNWKLAYEEEQAARSTDPRDRREHLGDLRATFWKQLSPRQFARREDPDDA